MDDRQVQAVREGTVGAGTRTIFFLWLVVLIALIVLYFVIGIGDV